jgi:hypothetical protein
MYRHRQGLAARQSDARGPAADPEAPAGRVLWRSPMRQVASAGERQTAGLKEGLRESLAAGLGPGLTTLATLLLQPLPLTRLVARQPLRRCARADCIPKSLNAPERVGRSKLPQESDRVVSSAVLTQQTQQYHFFRCRLDVYRPGTLNRNRHITFPRDARKHRARVEDVKRQGCRSEQRFFHYRLKHFLCQADSAHQASRRRTCTCPCVALLHHAN